MKTFERRLFIFFLLCCSTSSPALAANFFESDAAVSFRLEAPFNQLRSQRGIKTKELAAKVYYQTDQGIEKALSVKVEARGDFRRKRSTCYFLPYWINFKKSEVKNTPFAGFDRVKVVPHCNHGWTTYEPYMYTEYLCYKTYNILTDLSFRVRLSRIDYINTDKKKNREEGVFGAFFIEHSNSVEKRLSAEQVKDRFVLPSRYDVRKLCIAEMFQFFIGNTDFSFFASEDECCHNAKTFDPGAGGDGLIPFPYDFDMSGIVNAPYAKPNPNFPIMSNKHRLYRGVEVDADVWSETIMLYFEKRDEIYALWETFEPLEPEFRAKALDFIDEFYRIFDSREKSKLPFIAEMRSFKVVERSIQKDIDKQEKREARKALKAKGR